MPEATLTLKEAAERVGVAPATLKRWADAGVIPEVARRKTWTPSAVPHARVVKTIGDAVVEAVRGSASHLRFEGIGEVKLKGFDEPRQLCRATAKQA